MSHGDWIPLIDYSSKYSVSISTLRRRIKAGKIAHKKIEGKYLIEDNEGQPAMDEINLNQKLETLQEQPTELPITDKSSEDYLVNEIKSAFRLVLQEKEEHIFLLKEECTHLNKLVSLLERENDVLKAELKKNRGDLTATFKPQDPIDRLLES